MTLQKRVLKGFLAAFAMLICYTSFMNAQTIVKMINNHDNSVVFRIDNMNTENSPSKILLVYDSNLTTLETTSPKSIKYYVGADATSTIIRYSPASALVSTLAVEMEKEIELEEWMLEPFITAEYSFEYLKTDFEEEVVVETWMTNLNSWE